ncbi:putative Actin A [Blattamonas nauphoetae]|uniref:Actin A n=1 Tax=Blattamonas nauphoetae TaxID=2049346 RepID=A0ABQ9XKT8_9EUKA|nr:putative Actin A [Blattamonas nauphoetae]
MLGDIIDGQSHDIGSSLHISKCRHISSSLASLVPLTEISHRSPHPVKAGKPMPRFEETHFEEETTISASELAISDSCLSFGTGPLIGFGCGKDKAERVGEQAALPRKVSTLLAKSQIVNTTSHPSNWIAEDAGRMELTQRVTSSCVCSSTNHLYGTACVDGSAEMSREHHFIFFPPFQFDSALLLSRTKPQYIVPTVLGERETTNPHSSITNKQGLDDHDFFVDDDTFENQQSHRHIRFIDRGIVTDWNKMEKFYEQCYFRYLQIDPKDHPVITTETPFNTPKNRESLAEIMFEKFTVPKMCIAPTAMLAIMSSWISKYQTNKTLNGTVIDCGERVTDIIPVVDGSIVHSAMKRIPIGGADATKVVLDNLQERGEPVPQVELPSVARAIKEQRCYVTSDIVKEYNLFDTRPTEFFKTFKGIHRVTKQPFSVDVGYERFLAPEIFFNPSLISADFTVPVPVLVDQAIQQSPIDCRRLLYGNICLSGGSSMFRNYDKKLLKEIRRTVDERLASIEERTGAKPTPIDVKVISTIYKHIGVFFGSTLVASSKTFPDLCKTKAQCNYGQDEVNQCDVREKGDFGSNSKMAQKGESMIPPGYTLVRPISEGAFGRVLEIKESSTGKSYALKLIPRLTEADQKRAEREVSLLERFRHPRIVGLHESVVMDTYHGIVMDLGVRNLKDLMTDFESRNELIPLEVAVMICIDIAEGLSVMHNHPTHAMCHGDLKPENVLLTEDNRAMLCDLGAADPSGVNTSHSAKEIGTFEYNSPERLDDTDQQGTPASDIWSLGVILHRMVTGKTLFGGGSLTKMIKAISEFDESKISTSHPPAVRGVLVRLLDPNPDSRATSTQLFKGRQLEKILGPETPLSKMKDRQLQNVEKEVSILGAELSTLKTECKSLQETKADYYSLLDSLNLEKIAGLPPLIIHPRGGYQIQDQTLTRVKVEGENDNDFVGRIGIAEPISRGIVSISITLHTLQDQHNFVIFLTPSAGPLSSLDTFMKSDYFISLISSNGQLQMLSPWTGGDVRYEQCHQPLKASDTVVIEVNMETNPHTVQFFVNGNIGKFSLSHVPDSMCVMISTFGVGTSFRLNGVTRLTTPTPIDPEEKVIPW